MLKTLILIFLHFLSFHFIFFPKFPFFFTLKKEKKIMLLPDLALPQLTVGSLVVNYICIYIYIFEGEDDRVGKQKNRKEGTGNVDELGTFE